jgi:hypothetical protein
MNDWNVLFDFIAKVFEVFPVVANHAGEEGRFTLIAV